MKRYSKKGIISNHNNAPFWKLNYKPQDGAGITFSIKSE